MRSARTMGKEAPGARRPGRGARAEILVAVLATAAAAAALGCGATVDFDGYRASPGAGGGSSSAGGGAGGDAGSTGPGGGDPGGGDPGGNDGGGGGSAMCSEEPCKLVAPQCGCSEETQCSFDTATESRYCAPRGENLEVSLCGGDNGQCAPGLYCAPVSPSTAICVKFCEMDAHCDEGARCELRLVNKDGEPYPGVLFCSHPCDPLKNDVCPPGTACQLVPDPGEPYYTFCQGAGQGEDGAPCSSASECAPTFTCASSNGAPATCRKYCDVKNPVCPTGTTCKTVEPPAILNGTEYGFCG